MRESFRVNILPAQLVSCLHWFNYEIKLSTVYMKSFPASTSKSRILISEGKNLLNNKCVSFRFIY